MAFDLSKLLDGVSDPGTREQIEYLRLDQIENDPNNFYQLSDIENLADNIQLCGLQQPIRVRPIPGDTEKYRIVSGHRRRAAVELLAKEDPQRWDAVACIVEDDAASESLQQLRLIFANSNTRTMTAAEISEQAVQTEALLYKLKEEEGFEFPGRMRDHVAEVVGASKSKLARLKVIRENLAKCWMPKWKSGVLNESVAYELAQMPKEDQTIILQARGDNGYLDVKYIKAFRERFVKIDASICRKFHDGESCHNAERKKTAVASDSPYNSFYCDKCCGRCPNLTSCKNVCPAFATKAAQLRADKRAARKQEIAAEREAERPKAEKVSSIWHRFGLERSVSCKSVKDVKDAMGDYFFSDDAQKYCAYESGAKSATAATKLPYGMYLYDAARLTAVADLFNCSVDYLLCRTDIKEMAQPQQSADDLVHYAGVWHPICEEPPMNVDLIWVSHDGYADSGEYKGGRIEAACAIPYAEARFWSYFPSEGREYALPVSNPGTRWKKGLPEASGTYVAYVQMPHSTKQMLRELQWDGEAWFLFGTKIDDDVRICCWTEQPEGCA